MKQMYEMIPEWKDYQVSLPKTSFPPYEIDQVTLDEEGLGTWGGVTPYEYMRGRSIPPGTYTRLRERLNDPEKPWEVWMSDTPAEIIDHWEPINFLRSYEPVKHNNTVLITGLGIGMVVGAALRHGRDVVVIEKDFKIIQMVQDHYYKMADQHEQLLTIVHDDALTWRPNGEAHYEYIWHDIWPNISDMNLFQMVEMFKQYAPYVSGSMNAWCIEECVQMDMVCRVDRRQEEVDDLWSVLHDMTDGDWYLADEFMATLLDGRVAEDIPEGWTIPSTLTTHKGKIRRK